MNKVFSFGIINLKEGICMKTIFLDVDGVIYPCHDRKLLSDNSDKIKKKLVKKDRIFKKMNALELQFVYEGWDQKALYYVKKLVENSGANIVISSSWKYMRSLEYMKLLFKIYDLDRYVIDLTKDTDDFSKVTQITDYLNEHVEIEEYVILDDIDLRKNFPYHCVVCPDVITADCYEEALKILGKK